MQIVEAPVEKTIEIEDHIHLLKVYSPDISSRIVPGQFLNIKVSHTTQPLLRRPFSVCDVEGDFFYIMFNIFGEGTRLLASKQKGEKIDLLGPLGNGFNLDDDYDTAVLVAGGLGAAPFPFVSRLIKEKKKIFSFVGGRTRRDVITYGLENISIATDDGSRGFAGNVVDLLNENIETFKSLKIKIFACGPNAMLRAVKNFAETNNFNTELSTEAAMACGFGICQGCPIESAKDENKYLLVCKDGPVFNAKDVII